MDKKNHKYYLCGRTIKIKPLLSKKNTKVGLKFEKRNCIRTKHKTCGKMPCKQLKPKCSWLTLKKPNIT